VKIRSTLTMSLSLTLTLAITTQVMSASASEMPATDTARYQAVLALKPVGYWSMDEGKGNILHDQSGNGKDGKLINTDKQKNSK